MSESKSGIGRDLFTFNPIHFMDFVCFKMASKIIE